MPRKWRKTKDEHARIWRDVESSNSLLKEIFINEKVCHYIKYLKGHISKEEKVAVHIVTQ